MIKAIIFDFDGVIVESAQIKTRAFRRLFERVFPDEIEAIVRHHRDNMGISRFEKFRHIYNNIVRLPLSKAKEAELGRRFSALVLDEVLKAPYVGGAEEFFRHYYRNYSLFIASGTPDRELKMILSRRKISRFFQGIYGASSAKEEIIARILADFSLKRAEAVFVGDAASDLRAASVTGISFIGRIYKDNYRIMNRLKWKISDLTELFALIRQIEVKQAKVPVGRRRHG